ncbi:GNAT family N-acetyltransferase [Amycolatopsis sp. SID8362]|uniref:GNAT family N-acetyltransferase n=1 Tax=Amycolatopsis sp. SID8362 TaxID=2690346 RepID=UPI00136A77C3|nr:GNAT family N-acetyltransferase [Amycolatopsis sp. SID8362]NBH05869.1 GNAT family N-acetyltransferase [Amycolatopsis sp. SID8362]NED42567.1 GNAT family N-acetyltransferase [Amycolatopsis sp. SID8362]
MTLTAEKITPANVAAACQLAVEPHQKGFVAPVAVSLAEAYTQPEVAWPRLILDDGEPVAFVMGGFDPHAELDFFRCGVWRLNVGAGVQGRGYGRFAVETVLEEARRRGNTTATVLWIPAEGGPEDFYLKLGFRPTGQTFRGEVVGRIEL